MLGLGTSMITSEFVGGLPPISSLTGLTVAALESTSADDGTGAIPSVAQESLFDLRIYISVPSEYTGTVSDYVVTSMTIKNSTTDSAVEELVSSPLTMDSELDPLGIGGLYYLFDNDSPMDDLDLGSLSGSTHAHDGSDENNSFVVVTKITVEGYEGEATVTRTFSLSDSDAEA